MNIRISSSNVLAGMVSFLLSCVLFSIIIGINIYPDYRDFVVGNIAWTASSKVQDLISIPLTILFFVGIFRFFSWILKKTNREDVDEAVNQSILWVLPTVMMIVSQFWIREIDKTILYWSCLGTLFVTIACIANANSETKLNIVEVSIVCLSVFLVSLFPYEVMGVINRCAVNFNIDEYIKLTRKISHILAILLSLSVVALMIVRADVLQLMKKKIVFFAQIGLALLYILIYPSVGKFSGENFHVINGNIWLKIFVGILIIAVLLDVFIRYVKYRYGNPITEVISPFAFFGIIVAFRYGIGATPGISTDDYHFGESLIGWWSYINGRIPYIDYYPAHGVAIDDFSMLISSVFFEGAASAVVDSSRIASVILAFVAYFVLYKTTKSVLVAFLSVLFNTIWINLILSIFICIFINREICENPIKWMCSWLIASTLLILFMPNQGVLLVASTGILWLVNFYKCYSSYSIGEMKCLIGVFFIWIFVILFTPVGLMLFGAVRYVLENGVINQVSYGIPWSSTWGWGVLNEIARTSWALVALGFLLYISANWRDLKDAQNPIHVVVISCFLLFLFIPYSKGRIDYGFSRDGIESILAFSVLVPLCLYVLFGRKSITTICVITCVSCSLMFGKCYFDSKIISSSATHRIDLTAIDFSDMRLVGMPNIGKGVIDDKQKHRLEKINSFLKENLKDSQTYLDLTSRNAQYYYFNRLPPVAVTAPYNMVPVGQQEREVDKLMKTPPLLSLLWADNIIHDGGGVSLRSPLLSKFVQDVYMPIELDGVIYGVLKGSQLEKKYKIPEISVDNLQINDDGEVLMEFSDRGICQFIRNGDLFQSEDLLLEIVTNVSTSRFAAVVKGGSYNKNAHNSLSWIKSGDNYAAYRASLFHKALGRTNLDAIPMAWGGSSSLEDKLDKVHIAIVESSLHDLVKTNKGTYRVVGKDPNVTFNLLGNYLKQNDLSFLTITLSCNSRRSTVNEMQVFWKGDFNQYFNEENSIRFTGRNGKLIVPLYASSFFSQSKNIEKLRLDLNTFNGCEEFKVEDLSVKRRTER